MLNIHVTFVTYTYNASVSIDEIALSSLKAIDHRYNKMFPVHFAMDFLLFLTVYECAVRLPYICEIKKVTQTNVSRAYHGAISATLIGVLLVFTNLCYLVQPIVSYFNKGAKSLYQY